MRAPRASGGRPDGRGDQQLSAVLIAAAPVARRANRGCADLAAAVRVGRARHRGVAEFIHL